MKYTMIRVILVSVICIVFVHAHAKIDTSPDGSGGSIKFTTPDLNDEEQESPFMPSKLQCDACRVVSIKLYEAFREANRKFKKLKNNLPESEVIDVFENLCYGNAFDNYGLKQVEGINRLSGPGLETADSPGVMAGGGRWPSRLKDMCEQYMGDVGEMEIYNQFKEDPSSLHNLETFLCYDSGIRGKCSPESNGSKKEKSKKEEL